MKNILHWLSTKKNTTAFQRALEHSRQTEGMTYEDPTEGWFIDTHVTIDELREGGACVLWLRAREYGDDVIARANLVYKSMTRELLIGDIVSDVENQGNGSIVMRCIIDIAHILNAEVITGNISATDKDHFDKLQYFYEKHGFTFMLDKPNGEGGIRLELS